MALRLKQLAVVIVVVFTALASGQAQAQSGGTGTLRGQVSDPSGAVIPNATVAILQSGGPTHSAKTNNNGGYEIGNLPPGSYTVTANAQGFNVFVQSDVAVTAGQVAQFNIALEIQVEQQKINVQEETPQVQVNPENNASAVDPDRQGSGGAARRSRRTAVRSCSAGRALGRAERRPDLYRRLHRRPASAEVIDSRDSHQPESVFGGIRQARLRPHRNLHQARHRQVSRPVLPWSATTRHSTRATRFSAMPSSRPTIPSSIMGNIGGPINKKASFFLDVQRRNIDEIAIVDAPAIDLAESVPNPRTRHQPQPAHRLPAHAQQLDYRALPVLSRHLAERRRRRIGAARSRL